MSDQTVRTLLLATLVAVASLGGVVGAVGASTSHAAAGNDADAAITGGAVLPGSVAPDANVADQRVSLRLANVSADDRPDTVSLVFPDPLARNVSNPRADASSAGTVTVGSPAIVDGPDDDGVRDTVRTRVNASGGGSVDVTLDVWLDVTYPDRNATYRFGAVLLDSRSGVSTAGGVATVVVGSGETRRGANRSANTDGASQNVDVAFSDPGDIEQAKVKVKGKVKNTTLATLPAGCLGPTNRTPFVYNQDVDVHVNNATGDIGKLKVKVKSKVKKIDFADAPRVRANGTNASALCEKRSTGGATTDSGSLNGLFGWGSRTNAAGTGASTSASGSGGFTAGLLGGGLSGLAAAVFRVLG